MTPGCSTGFPYVAIFIADPSDHGRIQQECACLQRVHRATCHLRTVGSRLQVSSGLHP
jgi:hypothetical protein